MPTAKEGATTMTDDFQWVGRDVDMVPAATDEEVAAAVADIDAGRELRTDGSGATKPRSNGSRTVIGPDSDPADGLVLDLMPDPGESLESRRIRIESRDNGPGYFLFDERYQRSEGEYRPVGREHFADVSVHQESEQ